jgi:hypothetical protein
MYYSLIRELILFFYYDVGRRLLFSEEKQTGKEKGRQSQKIKMAHQASIEHQLRSDSQQLLHILWHPFDKLL